LLKKGTVDYKNGRKLKLRKAVKKEPFSQFLEGETSLPLQTKAPKGCQEGAIQPVFGRRNLVTITKSSCYGTNTPPTVHVQTAQPSHTCKNIGFKNEQRQLEFNEAGYGFVTFATIIHVRSF
ncbi:unnamed protein product, partial [Porites lobata]